MKPYYEDKNTTLYLGNCLDILPRLKTETFDAIITDPPYCSGGTSLSQKTQSTSSKYLTSGVKSTFPDFVGDSKDQRGFAYWCHLWLSECHRLTKSGGLLCQFTDWRQLPNVTDIIQAADWAWRGVAVWNKTNSRPQKGKFRSQCEYIVWASKGAMSNQGPCLPGCFTQSFVTNKKRLHQTQKPDEVMEAICKIAWPEDAIILDPFSGSGSTLAAAKRLGKRAVGIEMSEHYAEKTANRLFSISAPEKILENSK